jgi:hypothetical protein
MEESMTSQFDPQTDERLNYLDAQLADALARIAVAEGDKAEAWESIYATFDTVVPPGAPVRFIAASGMTLARQVTDPEERVNEAKLEEVLRGVDSALWESVSTPIWGRKLDMVKLERAIATGRIDPALVKQAIEKPKSVTSKHRRIATPEDKAFLIEQRRNLAHESATG